MWPDVRLCSEFDTERTQLRTVMSKLASTSGSILTYQVIADGVVDVLATFSMLDAQLDDLVRSSKHEN